MSESSRRPCARDSGRRVLDRRADDVRGDQGEGEREPVYEHALESGGLDDPIRLSIRMASIGEPFPQWA